MYPLCEWLGACMPLMDAAASAWCASPHPTPSFKLPEFVLLVCVVCVRATPRGCNGHGFLGGSRNLVHMYATPVPHAGCAHARMVPRKMCRGKLLLGVCLT